jgi:tripartite ATP-independent transporter DctP family solute receptor
MLDDMSRGGIDLTLAPTAYLQSLAPKMDVLQMPFLFESYEAVDRILDVENKYGRQLLDDLGRRGMTGLAFWELGFRHITTSRRRIVGPWDLKGLRVGTSSNEALIQAFRMLGASPATLPFADIYQALQRGVLDGQEGTIDTIQRVRLYEVQRHLSLTRHAYTALVLVMNRETFRSLSNSDRNSLESAAREATEFSRTGARELEMKNIRNLSNRGMQVEEYPDWRGFRKIVFNRVQEKFVREEGRDLLREINRYID